MNCETILTKVITIMTDLGHANKREITKDSILKEIDIDSLELLELEIELEKEFGILIYLTTPNTVEDIVFIIANKLV